MSPIDTVFGILAVVGFSVFVLSLIVGFVHDLHKFWTKLVGGTGPTTSAKVTVEELYESTPYAATRNAAQSIERQRHRG